MKTMRLPFLAICLMAACTSLFSQDTINLQMPTSINLDGAPPDGSAILDVKATGKGMLTPRMTTAQRTAIATPATGLLVYDTDTGSFWFFENNTWNEILNTMPPSEGGSAAPATPIPDCNPAGISSVINLSGTDTVAADTRFRVCLNITHTWTGDLDISLTAPDGTAIDLSSGNGALVTTTPAPASPPRPPAPSLGVRPPFPASGSPKNLFLPSPARPSPATGYLP